MSPGGPPPPAEAFNNEGGNSTMEGLLSYTSLRDHIHDGDDDEDRESTGPMMHNQQQHPPIARSSYYDSGRDKCCRCLRNLPKIICFPVCYVRSHITNTRRNVSTLTESHPDEAHRRKLSSRWALFTNRYRWLILFVCFVIIWPLGMYSFPRFTHSTSSTFKAVKGSKSLEANEIYRKSFDIPEGEHAPVIVLLTQEKNNDNSETLIDGTSGLYKSTRDFALNFTSYLEALVDTFDDSSSKDDANNNINPDKNVEIDSSYLFAFLDDEEITTRTAYAAIGSYYAIEHAMPTLAKSKFASPDGQMTFLSINYATPTPQSKDTFLSDLTSYANSNVPEGVNVEFTGLHYFQSDMLVGVKADMELMDFWVLPLALLFLAVVLGNLPIMIIPILTIATTVFLSGAIMYPIALSCQVTQFTPSLMMSLIIAMSIDYSLFMLSRCAEDIASVGLEKQTAIESMLEHSGHTISVSGLTLCACFLGLLLLPLSMIRSVGLGASVAVMSALVVNLSLIPAILHTHFGDFCLKPNKYLAWICCNAPGNPGRSRMKRRGISYHSYETVENSDRHHHQVANNQNCDDPAQLPLMIDENYGTAEMNEAHQEIQDMTSSFWYRLGRTLLNPIKGTIILIIVIAFIIPIAYYFPQCNSSISFDLMMPSNSPSEDAFQKLGNQFGLGTLSPYRIIFDGSASNERVDTFVSFEIMTAVLEELSNKDQFPATPSLDSFTGITTLNGQHIYYAEYKAAKLCTIHCPLELPRTIAILSDKMLLSKDGMTTYTTAILNVDPYTKEGTNWLTTARHKIELMTELGNGSLAESGIRVYIQNGASEEYDAVQEVYSHFPAMIAVTLSTVFVLMTVFFKSIVVPIRSVLSIGLTCGFVFGLAVLVYQYGILDWTGIPSLRYTGAISWLPPVISFSIIVGLGLDYDVFLISRVLEYRMEGYNDHSAVLKGLYKTGGIITAAGVIMAVAFGGLLMSHTLILNQVAFLLTTAVLMDTFVIRTIVVPILMGYTKQYSWWPRGGLPEGRLDIMNLETQSRWRCCCIKRS